MRSTRARKEQTVQAALLLGVLLPPLFLADAALAAPSTPAERRGTRPIVTQQLAQQGFVPYRKRWALVVGIDQYGGGIARLRYAAADARAIRDLLLDHLGFDDVILLLNEQARRADILKAVFQLKEVSHQNDQIFFYFSGHGVSFGEGEAEIGYLLPQDAAGWDEAAVAIGGISMSDLRERLVKLPAKHILLAVDACYDGYAAAVYKSLPRDTENYLRIITTSKARQILTAGKRGQEVVESQAWGHSAFAFKLLEGLRKGLADGDGDGLVTAVELYSYLSPAVTSLTGGRQTPQFAELQSEEGEFVFLLPSPPGRKVEPATATAAPPLAAGADDPAARQPFRVTVFDDYLEVFNELRVLLWAERVSGRIVRGEVADLDADGSMEVVVGVGAGGEDTGLLMAFDAQGRRLWATSTTATYNYAGGRSGRLAVRDLLVADLFGTGEKQVVALAADEQGWYQARLTVIGAGGEFLSSYWHPGHLTHVAVGGAAPGSPKRIAVAGINNDLGRRFSGPGYPRVVFLLDPRNTAGEAPPYLGAAGRGSQLWYSVILPKEQNIARLDIIDREPDGTPEISVWTETGHIFYLDFQGNLVGRARGDLASGESFYRRIEP